MGSALDAGACEISRGLALAVEVIPSLWLGVRAINGPRHVTS